MTENPSAGNKTASEDSAGYDARDQRVLALAASLREQVQINPLELHPLGYNTAQLHAAGWDRLIEAGQRLNQSLQRLADETDGQHPRLHPWCGLGNSELTAFDQDAVLMLLGEWQAALQHLDHMRQRLAVELDQPPTRLPDELVELHQLQQWLDRLGRLPVNRLTHYLPRIEADRLDGFAALIDAHGAIHRIESDLVGWMRRSLIYDARTFRRLQRAWHNVLRLGANRVTLDGLSQAAELVDRLDTRFGELLEPLQEAVDALGDQFTTLLRPTERGLTQFAQLIDLAALLPSRMLRRRGMVYEQAELDDLLPDLCRRVAVLHEEEKELGHLLRWGDLGDPSRLASLQARINRDGLFARLGSDWRQARDELLTMRVLPDQTLDDVRRLLPRLERLLKAQRELAADTNARELLGHLFQGVATNVDELRTLRKWYRQVREQLGGSASQDLDLADALITLEPGRFRELQVLSTRKLPRLIRDELDELDQLRALFARPDALGRDDVPLVGPNGVLPRLREPLTVILEIFNGMLVRREVPLEDYASSLHRLERLQMLGQHFQTATFDHDWFDEQLGLSVKRTAEQPQRNREALEFLRLARELYHPDCPAMLREVVLKRPNAACLRQLAQLGRELKERLETEAAYRASFSNFVQLQPRNWFGDGGDRLPATLLRVERALADQQLFAGWQQYLKARDEFNALGFWPVLERFDDGRVPMQRFNEAWQLGLYDMLARHIRHQPLPTRPRASASAPASEARGEAEPDQPHS